MRRERGQSHVVGVALLLGITVVALGTLTASIGTVIESNAARADALRVADDLETALEAVEVTGVNRGRVAFTEGQLYPVERNLTILNDSELVRNISVDGLVFEHGGQRVASVAGAVIVGRNGSAVLAARPPFVASEGTGEVEGLLVVGAVRLGDDLASIGGSTVRTTIRTDVKHERTYLGMGNYSLAIETETPAVWERYFERQNATTTRRDIDGDGIVSVVAHYPGEQVGYLVVHDLNAEVERG